MVTFYYNEAINTILLARKRLGGRLATSEVMTFSDRASFDVAESIDREYRLFCPEKTLIVCTNDKSPLTVVNEIRKEINL